VKTILIAALLVTMTGAVPSAQPVPESTSIADFNAAIQEYVAMHRRLEKLVGPITLNSTVESINRSVQALAAAIRVERSTARQGDLLTTAIAGELRMRVNDALRASGLTAADVLASQLVEGVDPSAAHLQVNGTFPWILATSMFPCVIAALPPLPPELQYRVVGNDLVLIDVHASLVVDILPNLLLDATASNAP
jgi:hypothetical protein